MIARIWLACLALGVIGLMIYQMKWWGVALLVCFGMTWWALGEVCGWDD
jgi:hypothetical protein